MPPNGIFFWGFVSAIFTVEDFGVTICYVFRQRLRVLRLKITNRTFYRLIEMNHLDMLLQFFNCVRHKLTIETLSRCVFQIDVSFQDASIFHLLVTMWAFEKTRFRRCSSVMLSSNVILQALPLCELHVADNTGVFECAVLFFNVKIQARKLQFGLPTF